MQKSHTQRKKDVFVTIVVTESTSSLLSLDAPHLEHTHPDNSKICVLTEKDFKQLKKSLVQEEVDKPSTSVGLEGKLKINSEVALFSTSNCSSSSELNQMSDSDFSSTFIEESPQESFFRKTDIISHPLVAVRSMAHANKVQLDGDKLCVSMLESDSSRISTDLICRICHGGESFDDLLTPCRCRGTIALVHLKCLERWLKESNHNSCELCQHHYRIVREPKYSIPWSILVFLRHPGSHLKEIILDLMSFTVYTPSAVASTYMLMLICEALVKNNIVTTGSLSSHIIAFSAVFGMAAIDFTYSSWLIMTMQKHVDAWRNWYNSSSQIRVVLPKIKMKPHKKKSKKERDK
ncbi:E3 ubiquitin-protein ligase MARCHF3-like [Anthonomus grandis grandis]|uniref:E3 ubiquitin-protein ligase MARCHF3-like n=1 Tax=Anthonomus grandis grandis TaxID=2921223 RepID=UPI002164F35C|nr:E3 ubiquitin-protein ligase MARCHF3-like [Anthonomus grandis grandis]